jgi:hypothetical protein
LQPPFQKIVLVAKDKKTPEKAFLTQIAQIFSDGFSPLKSGESESIGDI